MSHSVDLLHSQSLPRVDYAYAASASTGRKLLFLAGACPLDVQGKTVAVGDYERQAAQCIDNLRSALREANATLHDVVTTRVLVASDAREDLVKVWNVVRGAFAPHEPPSTLYGVTVLGYEHQLVEIEAVASIQA